MRNFLCLLVGITCVGCRTMPDTTWVEHALAQQELAQGQADNAILILEDCKKRNPDYAMTYLTLAAAWARQGNTDKFRENIEAYLALNPSHHVAGLYLAEAQFKQQRFDEAKKSFQAYLAAEKGSDSKSLEHRYHALARLAEIAESDGNELDRHLYLGRALHQQALSELAASSESGVSEQSKDSITEVLTFALEELQDARELSADRGMIDREIAAVTSLREDVEEGRADKIALLLSSTTSAAASGEPSKDRYRSLLSMSPLSGLSLPTPHITTKMARNDTTKNRTGVIKEKEFPAAENVTVPTAPELSPLAQELPAVEANAPPSPDVERSSASPGWKSPNRKEWSSQTAN